MFPCIPFQGGYECRLCRSAIAGQQVFMERLVKLVKMVARESGNRKKKVISILSKYFYKVDTWFGNFMIY